MQARKAALRTLILSDANGTFITSALRPEAIDVERAVFTLVAIPEPEQANLHSRRAVMRQKQPVPQ